ncbi:MBL fold metallo-hydrolase [Candidatus Bipolaricaulota bacterium]|nr:MBL fold metallo-hydrolase [Candidatus Bipolaricaulota bacterium]
MSDGKASFSTDSFQVDRLADGVFAVVGDRDGLCHSNGGIIDLGDTTLVFDTLAYPEYGAELAAACRDLTGRDPTWIALSHYHADHWLGAQAFPKSTVFLATDAMLPLVKNSIQEYVEAVADPQEVVDYVEQQRALLNDEGDPKRVAVLQLGIDRIQKTLDALPTLDPREPNTMFTEALLLVGSQRSVELIEVRHAHTASDVYLRLPEEGIVFMGDLGFFDTIPFLLYADPLIWSRTLTDLAGSGAKTFVPGHGVVGVVDYVERQRECIDAIVCLARQAIAERCDPADLFPGQLHEPFRTWASRGRFNEANFKAVYDKLQQG